ncbi:Acyl-CoA dehydrogenase; probable dibenzothiophene desulfurization enzyme [plant metagenome]|uniref:Acyl-CoA dehydrogenase probable dibenzothiophene desulfurization enzyme n=1 Tax=plant metagenome TaxID=1297885 RepID=A0A484VBU8_9ZZZZ
MSAPHAAARQAAWPAPGQVARIVSDAHALEVAASLAETFAPGASERDRLRRLPWDELARWSASGLGGMTVPREYGGAQVTSLTVAEVFCRLSEADPSLGQIPQNHFGFLWRIREIGTPAQQRGVFQEALDGRRFGNAGPERKTRNMLHISTRLRREEGGLRLHGHRYYSTGALFAHWIPTRATDDEGALVHVWVRRDAPGLTVIDDWDAFGQRTTASGSVVFDGTPVEPGHVIAALGGAGRPSLLGPYAQLMQAAIDQGIAQAALADAKAFVRERARPWMDAGVANAADDPYVIQEVGRLQIDVQAAGEVLREAAQTLDELASREPTAASSSQASVAVAAAKVLTTEAALQASEKLFELSGASSTRASHNLDRHWRNARTHTLHDPVRWKLHLLGNDLLNGALAPQHPWN